MGSNLDGYIDRALGLFQNLNEMWGSAGYVEKQKLQRTLFPEGIVYDRQNDEVRTPKVNLFLDITRYISMGLKNKKSGQIQENPDLSAPVTSSGFKPETS